MPSLTPEAWAQIRHDYEHTSRPVEDICVEHGISSTTLRDRMRRWGWARRRPPVPAQGPAAFAPARPRSRPQQPWTPDADAPPDGGAAAFAAPDDAGLSPHRVALAPVPAPTDDGATLPVGTRLKGAVARVLPAIEATLAALTSGPMRAAEMERTARALGALTRTLRELNALLERHGAQEPEHDVEELRRSMARKLEAVIAAEREERPQRYLAAWNELAAEAGGHAG